MAEQSEHGYIVATEDIEDMLNQLIALPDNGEMNLVATIKGVKVFLWNYAE